MPSSPARTSARSLPPRLRIVVRGSSVGINVGPVRSSNTAGTYSELLEHRLRADGIDAWVTNLCSNYERVNEVLPAWFDELARDCPDVVVLNYGAAECQPNIFPTSMLKWVQTRRSTPPLGPVRGRMARALDPLVRRFVSRTMRRLSTLLGMRTWRLRPERFETELERLIRVVRNKTVSLVLVVTTTPASPRLEKVLARLHDRSERMAAITREVVARFDDPNVKLIDLFKIIDEMGVEDVLYDGFHMTVEAHQALAAEMERAIIAWMDSGGAA